MSKKGDRKLSMKRKQKYSVESDKSTLFKSRGWAAKNIVGEIGAATEPHKRGCKEKSFEKNHQII